MKCVRCVSVRIVQMHDLCRLVDYVTLKARKVSVNADALKALL